MNRVTFRRRAGLTLFGLLVVLAIIALLLAMLLPAIQKVRQAADRMLCATNLRQMAIAIYNFHNDYNKFPSTGEADADLTKEPLKGSWCFVVLPYLEQENLRQLITQGNPGNVAVKVFYSPTRRPAQLYNGLPKIDYAGNAGTADDPEKPDQEDGAFTKESVSIGKFTDGTSNTLLLGVKGLRTTEYQTGKGAGDKNSCWVGGTTDTLRSSGGNKRPPMRDAANEDHDRGFGSPLDKTCNFVFCDGSVRAIPYTVKGDVFQALCGRNDGVAVNLDDF
jgi:prepilin-type processing-associated H-X9-DG protein